MPWDHWWYGGSRTSATFHHRAAPDPAISAAARAVVFDDAGPDVAAWLRQVGFVLSTSDDESSMSHLRRAWRRGSASPAHWPRGDHLRHGGGSTGTTTDMARAIRGMGRRRVAAGQGPGAPAGADALRSTTSACHWLDILTSDLPRPSPIPSTKLLGAP